MSTLHRLAAEGKTVICTIHQPPSETYALFDDVLLLSQGQTVYIGDRAGALSYFEANGLPCPSHFNPPDHFVSRVVDGDNVQLYGFSMHRSFEKPILTLKEKKTKIGVRL